jgi:hypothetical protein
MKIDGQKDIYIEYIHDKAIYYFIPGLKKRWRIN